jgi:AAA domain
MMRNSATLFSILADGLEATLRTDNIWWRGERQFGLPSMRRWAFGSVMNGLKNGLTPVTVLRGPRQIGKTTLLNQVIDQLLSEGVDPTDDPRIVSIPLSTLLLLR